MWIICRIANLKKIVTDNKLQEKIIFISKLPFEKLFEYTVNADLGLTLDKDTNINYRFSLPNKLFDYIHAGIPVLASNLVEIRKIIEEYDIGCITLSHDPEKIAEKINFMLFDEESKIKWKANLMRASAELNWNNEEKKLIGILKKYA